MGMEEETYQGKKLQLCTQVETELHWQGPNYPCKNNLIRVNKVFWQYLIQEKFEQLKNGPASKRHKVKKL